MRKNHHSILILGSCTASKNTTLEKREFDSKILETKEGRVNLLSANLPMMKSRDLYTGIQHRMLKIAIKYLRKLEGIKVDYYIISAGFGLISENTELPMYDYTFNNMSEEEIVSRAKNLEIVENLNKLEKNNYDLIYLALGKKYMKTLETWNKESKAFVVSFHNLKTLPSDENIVLYIKKEDIKKLQQQGLRIHDYLGLKGDLLKYWAIKRLSKKSKDIIALLENKKLLQVSFSAEKLKLG